MVMVAFTKKVPSLEKEKAPSSEIEKPPIIEKPTAKEVKKSLAVEKLLKYLKEIKKSQRQFAKDLGISAVRLNQFLRCKSIDRIPSLEIAVKIESLTGGYVHCSDWMIVDE